MSATITYTPLTDTEKHSIDQLNALFTNLAAVINNKIDLDADQLNDVYTNNTTQVLIGETPVVVSHPARLTGNLSINVQQIINLKDDPSDPSSAVSVIDALHLLGIV